MSHTRIERLARIAAFRDALKLASARLELARLDASVSINEVSDELTTRLATEMQSEPTALKNGVYTTEYIVRGSIGGDFAKTMASCIDRISQAGTAVPVAAGDIRAATSHIQSMTSIEDVRATAQALKQVAEGLGWDVDFVERVDGHADGVWAPTQGEFHHTDDSIPLGPVVTIKTDTPEWRAEQVWKAALLKEPDGCVLADRVSNAEREFDALLARQRAKFAPPTEG